MNPSPRLPSLRYSIARAFADQQQISTTATPGLHHLLSVPIRERLILLARIDGATPHQIRGMLHCSIEDANCRSDVMLDAVSTWRSTIQDAFWHVPTRANWRFQKEASVEKGIKQLLWADVAVALIGDAALPGLVQNLSLQRRLILYLLMVDEAKWREIMPLFRCTKHEIRESIRIGFKSSKIIHSDA